MERFIGSFISLDCGEDGTYQGQIIHADDKKLTLRKVFCNGLPHSSRELKISADSIKSLEIIDMKEDSLRNNENIKIKKPIAKRAVNSNDVSNALKALNLKESPRKSVEERGFSLLEGIRTPNKKERQRQKLLDRDEAAFGSPMELNMSDDFDFEKNLALFNKKAVYDEINASKPDVVRQTDKKNSKYRCDENVLNSKPAVFRQLIVPQPDRYEYVTDSGLVVPSITPDLRNQIMTVAERLGLSHERQSELMGRAASEMALHLLGGAHRLNPHNLHQCPNVAVLCGSHRPGSQAVNCARHLASHGVRTLVYIQDPTGLTPEMTYELALYKMSLNRVTTSIQDLLTCPVDLIILALSDTLEISRQNITLPAAKWANENRAQVLAIDPPPLGTPGVTAKCSLVPALPLSHSQANGKIYLCNLGIPMQVFKDVGIKYFSPFGPKFFVVLHPNN